MNDAPGHGPDWALIAKEYPGARSIRGLARKHGVTHTAIRKRAERQGWRRRGVKLPRRLVVPIIEGPQPSRAIPLIEGAITAEALAQAGRKVIASLLNGLA